MKRVVANTGELFGVGDHQIMVGLRIGFLSAAQAGLILVAPVGTIHGLQTAREMGGA